MLTCCYYVTVRSGRGNYRERAGWHEVAMARENGRRGRIWMGNEGRWQGQIGAGAPIENRPK
jgi:hypothetical protein